jgi:hypothetical protein
MELKGLHILLTYECNLECDHCFVWGSCNQIGTFTYAKLKEVLQQAVETNTIEWVYFEGGEPGLYYPLLLKSVQEAAKLDFQVGIVSNGYWANSEEDAFIWLEPFQGLVQDLSISSDQFHWFEKLGENVQYIEKVTEELKIPIGVISIAQPEVIDAASVLGKLPPGQSGIMYRGRAAVQLADRAKKYPWETFVECPYEDLESPDRIHLDSLGFLHVCNGITIGNIFETNLSDINKTYAPYDHPVVGPLLVGGPVELVKNYGLKHDNEYADACHLCYTARLQLRERFPEELGPGQVYGELV